MKGLRPLACCSVALAMSAFVAAAQPPDEHPWSLPPDFGWLSERDTKPTSVIDALVGGKVHFNHRLRLEAVDQDGLRDATAITSRLRLGYETKAWEGFSAMVEMEWLLPFNSGTYFVPQTGDGQLGRAVIADPPAVELNQLWGRYLHAETNTDVKVGRQRILLDDQRFVGNVGWRQLEQTYDAASIRTRFGQTPVELFYAYIWEVRRVFGPDGPNPDSNTHLLNVAWNHSPALKLVGFAHVIDLDDDTTSNHTFGLRAAGRCPLTDEAAATPLAMVYELTFAYQTDAGDAPADYETCFIAAELGLDIAKAFRATAGYQYLGSDDGIAAFQFPLGTNHKFQGYADVFLTTPAGGLQDFYLRLDGNLPADCRGELTFHHFRSDRGNDSRGWEVDAAVSRQITRNWTILMKAAFFDGSAGLADRTKLWLQTEFSF